MPHGMTCQQSYYLELHSTPESIALVEPYVEQIAQGCDLKEDVYGNILVALTEAVNNAIIHGNQAKEEKIVKVVAQRTPESISFFVEDEGRGFDPDKIPDPTHPDNLLKPGGRGVFMMKKLCSNLCFQKRGRIVEIHFNI